MRSANDGGLVAALRRATHTCELTRISHVTVHAATCSLSQLAFHGPHGHDRYRTTGRSPTSSAFCLLQALGAGQRITEVLCNGLSVNSILIFLNLNKQAYMSRSSVAPVVSLDILNKKLYCSLETTCLQTPKQVDYFPGLLIHARRTLSTKRASCCLVWSTPSCACLHTFISLPDSSFLNISL